jgi:hypothetical protein
MAHHPHPKPGSSVSMIRQNQEIDSLNLPRIVDNNQLHQLEQSGELVRLPNDEKIKLAAHIREDRQYVRPWAKVFIQDMASTFYDLFGRPITVNSAVRTVEQQRELRRTNRFAAPENLSSHTAGITVDLAKREYNKKQRTWIKKYLIDMRNRGVIEFAVEPYCFHIAVMASYLEFH